MRLPKVIRKELEATGKPWEVEKGTNHRKIKVGGKLAGIIPLKGFNAGSRAAKNIIAQIRRAGNETQDRTQRIK